jgi:hypothetical protein
MSETIGQTVRMSPVRRFIGDLLYAGMQIPLVTIQKDMNVAEVAAARQLGPLRPSWCAIFTKAYGKVVASRPEMRHAVLSFPWERMYEYSAALAHIAIEVSLGEENALAFVPIKHPEACPLLEIDRIIATCQEKPLELLHTFKEALSLARFCPRFLRRWVWWSILNASGQLRSRYFGTFGVTSVGNWGIESVRPIAPGISILHYGSIDPRGNVSVRMTYDHRVLDSSGPSKALNEMEQFLKTDLVAELRALQQDGTQDGSFKID